MNVEKVNFKKLFRDIRMHIDVGLRLYKAQRTDDDSAFYEIFKMLDFVLKEVQKHQEYLSAHISEYDFVNVDGHHVKANGYRNVLSLLASVLQSLHQSLQEAAKDRSRVFFSASEHINSLFVCSSALKGVERLACYCHKLMEATPAPDLCSSGDVYKMITRLSIIDYFSRNIFYGRLLGLQYPTNMKHVLKMLGVGMASYEQWYRADKDEPVKQLLLSLWKGSRYLQSPTRLGLKTDYLTMDCSVHFMKAFWSLPEQSAFQSTLKLFCQTVDIIQQIEVPAKEMKVTTSGGEVEIKPPSIHVGYKPIPITLISYKWRGSQPRAHITKKQPAPLSPNLVVHIHGGGFVAQSPQTHEYHLRHWSFELDAPIVSIGYSLSPEAPFPRALEECVMAYCWILQNLEELGTTGRHIVFVGDSAGGNLAITTCMKLKELGIRLPDSILAIYPLTNIKSCVSPSRIMSLIDPFLPHGLLMACHKAYSNQQPTPEQLSLCKEYRRKIMRAQGYYLPDPDAKSPSWKKKRSSTQASLNSTHKDESANKMISKGSKSKLPPPRPPPPYVSVTKAQVESVLSKQCDQKEITNPDTMIDVPLDVDPCQAIDSLAAGVEVDSNEVEDTKELYKSKIPICFKQEPEKQDRLSPTDFEKLVEEVMRSYEDGGITSDPFMSPLLAPDELLTGLPPVNIIGAALDSALDDAIHMAQKLKSIQQPVTLNVVDNLPHGFLSLIANSDVNNATKLCLDYMKHGLNIHTPKK